MHVSQNVFIHAKGIDMGNFEEEYRRRFPSKPICGMSKEEIQRDLMPVVNEALNLATPDDCGFIVVLIGNGKSHMAIGSNLPNGAIVLDVLKTAITDMGNDMNSENN